MANSKEWNKPRGKIFIDFDPSPFVVIFAKQSSCYKVINRLTLPQLLTWYMYDTFFDSILFHMRKFKIQFI